LDRLALTGAERFEPEAVVKRFIDRDHGQEYLDGLD
jgi:hypothetical protein